jgi:hypothetical protein
VRRGIPYPPDDLVARTYRYTPAFGGYVGISDDTLTFGITRMWGVTFARLGSRSKLLRPPA